MRRTLMTTCLGLITATTSLADDAALLVGVERYEALDRLVQGTDPVQAGAKLGEAGFKIFAAENPNGGEMRRMAREFKEEAGNADRLVVALSGRFATDGERTWFMASNATKPDLFSVSLQSLSIETVMDILAQAPGQAVLVLAEDSGGNDVYDGALRAGIGSLEIPQGVTVVKGQPAAALSLLQDTIAMPDADLIRPVRQNRRLRADGYVPQRLVMTRAENRTPSERSGTQSIALDNAFWARVQALDTAQGYTNYIDQFPQGQHLQAARAALEAIRSEPNRAQRLAEEALELSRSDRRGIQRDLNVLDFNTRGIDGIFGPGTRQAIVNWQQLNGYAQTGYLTLDQISTLDAQAGRRAAELEIEAERARAAEERRDRAYWDETGARGDEAGLRAYLKRYPDGTFSTRAQNGLDQINEARRERAQQADREAWDQARQTNTVRSYQRYLNQKPNGAFRQEAQSRIDNRQRDAQGNSAREQASQREAGLNLDPISIRLIEARLDQLGLEPGRVDGNITDETRRAIRRYQRDRQLDRTGFLDQATVSRLLTDAFR